MATIPIEVIVQDAESPVTPTPVDPADQGENTNITVPDTGAGTVDSNSNNSFNNSSAAISIISIIIAVLAIGAVITLLVRKYHKRKTSEAGITRQEKRAMIATSTIAVLALTVLLGQLVVAGVVRPIATNAASDRANNNETTYLDIAEDTISIVATRAEDEDTIISTAQNTLYATTDAHAGYTVTMSMIADAMNANLYLDGDETSECYIAPVADDTLSNNTWGYTLAEEETYLSVPLAGNAVTIKEGDTPVEQEEIDVYYAVKVDKDLPAGTYKGTVEYNIEGNYGFPKSLTTMQGMTHEICEGVPTPGNQTTDPVPTATLIDIRDNKTYTVAKLADGNCWMTQNLDLDLNSQVVLTPENTNISANWTPANSTISFTGTTVDGWQNSNNVPYSADPGDIYYYTSGTNDNDIQYNSLAECEAAGRTDCSHYHAGNYYNWSAAVANNDTSGMAERFSNADTSICPAGWRLPGGPKVESTFYNEFIFSMKAYADILGSVQETQGVHVYPYLGDGFKVSRMTPLWLIRAGFIGSSGVVIDNGARGVYWLTSIDGSGVAYELYIIPQVAISDYSASRLEGHPLRCVAW